MMCCAAALGGWLAGQAEAAESPVASAAPLPAEAAALLGATWQGLDPEALWDAHAHLLGTGDAGSGCRVHPHLQQWWHPVESLRRRVIMGAAGVPADAPSVDRAYVARLQALAGDFPTGARWLLYAFDSAHDERGNVRPGWSTFHVPNAYAAQVAAADPQRFAWVASIHPYGEDALAQLDAAIAGGALAIKWLPSAMNIDLQAPRLRPFYDRLAAANLPLIVHGGEEKAVPGAERDALGNPLLFDLALKRRVSDGGARLSASVFDTRAQLARPGVSTVSPSATV
ncbi:amidohydrolase family protein [Aquabacterium sp.]|uniref:amidohydrolase family protein n=1 Tax=Aquabacterium sp. TaxID=1872578 RepID=UPI0037846A18